MPEPIIEATRSAEDREMRSIGFAYVRGIARATLIFEIHREQPCHFFWSGLEQRGLDSLPLRVACEEKPALQQYDVVIALGV